MSVPARTVAENDTTARAVQPRQVILHRADRECGAAFLAATEGCTRFITSVPMMADADEQRVDDLLGDLAAQSGHELCPRDIRGVILTGRPERVIVLGEPGADEAAAFRHAETLGIARFTVLPDLPPARPARHPTWTRAVLDRWQGGLADALAVVIPPGALPVWAAQLLTAINALPADEKPRCLFITADEELATLLPPGAAHLLRGADLPQTLIDTLARWRLARDTDLPVEATRAVYRVPALIAATQATETLLGRPAVYLDFSAGGTLIVSTQQTIQLAHFPALDCGEGAGAIVAQCGADRISHWLPDAPDAPAIRRWALRRMLWPQAVMIEETDRQIAGAFARAAARWIIAAGAISIPREAICVLGPAWLRWSTPPAAMRAAADIFPATGALRVALDAEDVMAAIGLLAQGDPESVASLLERDALAPLGTIVPLLDAHQRRADSGIPVDLSGDAGTARLAVAPAGITAIPFLGDATLSYRGKSGGRMVTTAVAGGQCGLLLDARPRPLTRSSESVTPRDSVSARLRGDTVAGGRADA